MSTIYDLEVLINDPDYFIDEYFGSIQNQIDIYAEEKMLKTPDFVFLINKEREAHFKELNQYKKKCKKAATDPVFSKEIDQIRTFLSTFDSKEENIQQKLEENINLMKEILLTFNEYQFEKCEWYFGFIRLKVKLYLQII